MSLRYVKVPENVKVKLPSREGEVEAEMTFAEFVRSLLDNNPLWGKSYKNIRAGLAIEGAFKDKAPGTWVALSSDDWEMLKECIEKPQIGGPGGATEGFGFIPQAVRQLVPFMDSVVEATDKEPALT